MNLFVTGATGFVGSHVAREAAAQGAKLRCLARATSNLTHLPKDVEVVMGDLREPRGFAVALETKIP